MQCRTECAWNKWKDSSSQKIKWSCKNQQDGHLTMKNKVTMTKEGIYELEQSNANYPIWTTTEKKISKESQRPVEQNKKGKH